MDPSLQSPEKWEGKLIRPTIAGASAEQVWYLVADFCGAHRLFPVIHTCRLESGTNGEPGCVRYATQAEAADGTTTWVKETLTSIDHVGHKVSYALGDNNLGWGRYEATIEVVAACNAAEESEGVGGGCRILWLFEMAPAEGYSPEGVSAFLGSMLEGAVKRIQETILLQGKAEK